MNIIDKNGRLFGRINLIDFSVIFILLFAVPMFVFAYKAMNAKEKGPTKWVTVNMKIQRADPELVEVLKNGDAEKDAFGKEIGSFNRLANVVPSSTVVLAGDPQRFIMVNDPLKKDIVIELRLLCKDNDGYLYYKNSPVKIGGSITFSTIMYDITGTVIRIDRS